MRAENLGWFRVVAVENVRLYKFVDAKVRCACHENGVSLACLSPFEIKG